MQNPSRIAERDATAEPRPAEWAGVPHDAAAHIARGARVSGRKFRRAWWIRQVDRPTVSAPAARGGRFSGADMFALYPHLKDRHDGPGAFEREQRDRRIQAAERMNSGRPGFELRDRQLGEAAWTLMRSMRPGEGLLSWTRIRVQTPEELGVPRYHAEPEEAARTVKAAARLYGAALAGVARMNENYVNQREGGREIVLSDVAVPEVSAERLVIPHRMRWVVALAIPMDLDLLAQAPSAAADAASGLGYSQSAFVVSALAEFIRGLGYQAIPSVNDTAQSVPFALDAGLGELSRMNKLVTPEFGAAVRLCKVFTDLPLACDKPIDFGAAELCRHCLQCAQACPAGALSFDPEPGLEPLGAWNSAGHAAWFEDSYKCFSYWQESGSACAVCLTSCPFTKAARNWVREAVEATVSLTPATDGLFRSPGVAFDADGDRDDSRWWMSAGAASAGLPSRCRED